MENKTNVIGKIILAENQRILSLDDLNINFKKGVEYELTDRLFRAAEVKHALFQGVLRLVSDMTLEFPYKDSTVVIEGMPGGNIDLTIVGNNGEWVKDFATGEIKPINKKAKISSKKIKKK